MVYSDRCNLPFYCLSNTERSTVVHILIFTSQFDVVFRYLHFILGSCFHYNYDNTAIIFAVSSFHIKYLVIVCYTFCWLIILSQIHFIVFHSHVSFNCRHFLRSFAIDPQFYCCGLFAVIVVWYFHFHFHYFCFYTVIIIAALSLYRPIIVLSHGCISLVLLFISFCIRFIISQLSGRLTAYQTAEIMPQVSCMALLLIFLLYFMILSFTIMVCFFISFGPRIYSYMFILSSLFKFT